MTECESSPAWHARSVAVRVLFHLGAPFAVFVVLAVHSQGDAANAGGPTQTPTPTATPVIQQVPAAPSNVRTEGSNLVWQDNSDNEDGFRILLVVGGGEPAVVRTVSADITTAPAPDTTHDQQCLGAQFGVVAFNAVGESGQVLGPTFFSTECGGGYVATPQPTALPPTGGGTSGAGGADQDLLAAAVAALLFGVVVTLAALLRRIVP
jgi:hypothetical protein